MLVKPKRSELWFILYPLRDPEYIEHLSYLEFAIKYDIILVEHRPFPRLPHPTRDEIEMLRDVSVQYRHDPSRVFYMARILFQEFKDEILKEPGLKIIGEPWYGRFRGDVGLVRCEGLRCYTPLVIVEIGTVRAEKPLRALELEDMRELWIPRWEPYLDPYEEGIYIFRRGPNWHLWEEIQNIQRLKSQIAFAKAHPFFSKEDVIEFEERLKQYIKSLEEKYRDSA